MHALQNHIVDIVATPYSELSQKSFDIFLGEGFSN